MRKDFAEIVLMIMVSFLFAIIFIVVISRHAHAGVVNYSCSGLAPDTYIEMKFNALNSANATGTIYTRDETQNLYLTTTAFPMKMKGYADNLGIAQIRIYSNSGTPSITGLTCGPYQSEYMGLVLAFAGVVSASIIWYGILSAM
jgi:hypothetical protein